MYVHELHYETIFMTYTFHIYNSMGFFCIYKFHIHNKG